MDFASQTQAQAPRRPFLTAPSFHRGGTTAQNFQRLIFGIFFRASPPGVHPGLEGVMSGTMAPTFQQLIHRPCPGVAAVPHPARDPVTRACLPGCQEDLQSIDPMTDPGGPSYCRARRHRSQRIASLTCNVAAPTFLSLVPGATA